MNILFYNLFIYSFFQIRISLKFTKSQAVAFHCCTYDPVLSYKLDLLKYLHSQITHPWGAFWSWSVTLGKHRKLGYNIWHICSAARFNLFQHPDTITFKSTIKFLYFLPGQPQLGLSEDWCDVQGPQVQVFYVYPLGLLVTFNCGLCSCWSLATRSLLGWGTWWRRLKLFGSTADATSVRDLGRADSMTETICGAYLPKNWHKSCGRLDDC